MSFLGSSAAEIYRRLINDIRKKGLEAKLLYASGADLLKEGETRSGGYVGTWRTRRHCRVRNLFMKAMLSVEELCRPKLLFLM